MARRDQAVLGAEFVARLIEEVASGRFAFALGGEPVGEFLAVVGQDFLDLERTRGGQALQESPRPSAVLSGKISK